MPGTLVQASLPGVLPALREPISEMKKVFLDLAPNQPQEQLLPGRVYESPRASFPQSYQPLTLILSSCHYSPPPYR